MIDTCVTRLRRKYVHTPLAALAVAGGAWHPRVLQGGSWHTPLAPRGWHNALATVGWDTTHPRRSATNGIHSAKVLGPSWVLGLQTNAWMDHTDGMDHADRCVDGSWRSMHGWIMQTDAWMDHAHGNMLVITTRFCEGPTNLSTTCWSWMKGKSRTLEGSFTGVDGMSWMLCSLCTEALSDRSSLYQRSPSDGCMDGSCTRRSMFALGDATEVSSKESEYIK